MPIWAIVVVIAGERCALFFLAINDLQASVQQPSKQPAAETTAYGRSDFITTQFLVIFALSCVQGASPNLRAFNSTVS